MFVTADARLIHDEELFVEPADFPGVIHKMDFKNPVPWPPVCAWIAHVPWILRVDPTNQGIWVVPSLRAVWIPAGYPHQVRMSGAVSLRTLYLKPELGCPLPRRCCAVNVSSFFRELILFTCELSELSVVGYPARKGERLSEFWVELEER